ncbi:MAG: NPCBM/NEW2 domain-containing protein [Planctomycetota bacterium]
MIKTPKYMLAASLLLALAMTSVSAAQLNVTVVQADGDEMTGSLKELNAEGATIEARKFASRDITQIKFTTAATPPVLTSPSVILRNQDVLSQSMIVNGGDTKLTLKTAWIETLDLDYKSIDAIVFYAASKKMPDMLAGWLKGAPPKEDALLLLKGETISGFYEKFTDKGLSFNAGGQSKTYALDQIAGLRIAATEKFEANKTLNATLRLIDGSTLTVKPLGLEGDSVKVEALDGKSFRLNTSTLASLEFSGGRMIYLSALNPKSVDQKPYVGGAPIVFSWRKDRSSANGPIKIGETVYDKGIGVHSYCKLVYDLNGEYAKFISDVGMDATAPQKAECAWKIVVDGKDVISGVARAGSDKKTVRLDVANAKTLELICDFGPDDDDAGDRLDFAKARLIKP